MDRAKRYEWISISEALSIRRQCELLCLDRGGFYYTPKGESELNLKLMELIDHKYQCTPFYGVPRMTDYLRDMGYQVNHKRIRRLYKVMDIRAIGPNPYTSKATPKAYTYPYLLLGLTIERPNQVWAADITYIGMPTGYLYLFAIMDVYSRYILGWDVANTMTTDWCVGVLQTCLVQYPSPDIFNTDQGSQFTATRWISALEEKDILISMDGKGRAIDNIFIERFWRSYKYEYLYLNVPSQGAELFDETEEYMRFYNFERNHQSLNRMPPAEKYFGKKTYFLSTKYSPLVV